MLPYLSVFENAIVFKGALQMTRFTYFTLIYHVLHLLRETSATESRLVR